MAINRIQFQRGLSMPEFFRQFGSEAQCEAALAATRWPEGFRCPHCGGAAHCLVQSRGRTLFQCNACRHQSSLIAGTVFQGAKLPLTVCFLAIHLISQAKTGLSALALKRQVGVSYRTAWLIQHKLMQAMAERENGYVLEGQVQVDDAYLGGERSGGKAGRGSENKVPFVAAVSLSDEGHPLRTKLTPVAGRKPRDLPEFEWINTVLGNLKSSLTGAYHAFKFRKYAERYLSAFAYRFNRHFNLRTLHRRLLVAAVTCIGYPDRIIRIADDCR